MLPRLLLAVFAGILSTTAVFAGEAPSGAPALSFQAFSQKVLAYYPRFKSAHGDVDIALAQQMQAKAGFWPSLDLSAGYNITNDPVNVFGMLLRQERFTSADFDLKRLNTPDRHQDLSAGVHVAWPLFDAMQTIGRARSAREFVKASQADEAYTKMEALLMAQDAYLNALTLEKLSSIIDEVQRSSEGDLQKAKDLKDKGMILGADYYSARVMFGDFTRMKNEIARRKIAMTALLNILMGESVNKIWTLTSTIKEAEAPLQDQQKLLEMALVHRPDLFALNCRFLASAVELSRERSAVLPHVSAFGAAAYDREKMAGSGGNNYAVGVKGELPLFDPSHEGRVKEATARKGQLEQNVQLLKDAIARDIAEEIARYDTFRDNMAVLKGMNDDAKEAVVLVVPLYSEGRKSIADLLEVRHAYLEAAQSYNKAVMGIWLSEARLLFLTGQLNEDGMRTLEEGAGL